MNAVKMNAVKQEAFRLHAAGYNLLPIKTDGSKFPSLATWREYIQLRAGAEEMDIWFGEKAPPRGLAVVCGEVSGNHIVFDGDSASDDYLVPLLAVTGRLSLSATAELLAKWEAAPVTRTPSGAWHKHLRCTEPAGKGIALAKRGVEVPEGTINAKLIEGKWIRPEVLIETRGQGHIAILPPSPAACHPLRKPYLLESGDLAVVPVVTPDELEVLLNNCRSFNEYHKPEAVVSEKRKPATAAAAEGMRPGDDFNSRGDHGTLLEKHGYRLAGTRGETELWTRPGKGHGISATFNHAGCGMFYPFSTNCDPLEAEKAYRPFALYAALEHGGDFSAAAKTLYAEGYGDRIKPRTDDAAEDDGAAGQECPHSAPGGPETGAEEKKVLPHVLPSIARRLRGLPVMVQETGLHVSPEASDEERRQIFKGLMRLAGDAELWLRFAIGDTYENLPGDFGQRAAWARKHYPGKYHTAKNYGWIARHWPLQIRDMTGRTPWSFYVVTADACFGGQTDRAELLGRWHGGEWKDIEELKAYKRTLKPAKESKAEGSEAETDGGDERGKAIHQTRADDFLNIFPDDFQALLREAIDSAGMNAVEAQLKALLRSAETRPKTGPKEAEKEAAPDAENSPFLDATLSLRMTELHPGDGQDFDAGDDLFPADGTADSGDLTSGNVSRSDDPESGPMRPAAASGHDYKPTYLYSNDQTAANAAPFRTNTRINSAGACTVLDPARRGARLRTSADYETTTYSERFKDL